MAVFEFTLCTENRTILVEIDGSPADGKVYLATGETGNFICGVVGNLTDGIPTFTADTTFVSCLDCLSGSTPSFTANSIYDSCKTCSGDTQSVPVPHPVWTGIYGESITQGNAVQLGGPNGLYM